MKLAEKKQAAPVGNLALGIVHSFVSSSGSL